MLTRDNIRRLTTENVYRRGVQIFYSKNQVRDFRVEKSHYEPEKVRARVRGNNRDFYEVMLLYDRRRDRLVEYSCECPAFANHVGICKHIVAVLLCYEDYQVQEQLHRLNAEETEAETAKEDGVKAAASAPAAKVGAARSAGRSDAKGAGSAPNSGAGGDAKPGRDAAEPAESAETKPVVRYSLLGAGEDDAEETYAPADLTDSPARHSLFDYVDLNALAGGTSGQRIGDMPAYTTELIQDLMGRQLRSRTATLTQASVYGQVRLEAKVHLEDMAEDVVEFSVGSHRMYIVKDIVEFGQLMHTHEKKRYGKELEITHTLEAFEPASRPLAAFLEGVTPPPPVFRYGNAARLYRDNFSFYHTPARYLSLPPTVFDALFRALGEEVTLIKGKETRTLRYSETLPPMTLHLEGTPLGLEVRVEVDPIEGLPIFRKGEEWFYFFGRTTYARRPRQDLEAVEDWLMLFSHGHVDRSVTEFIVSEEDVPMFCQGLLPQLETIFRVETVNFTPTSYAPERAELRFYLDAPDRHTVVCQAQAAYGEDAVYALAVDPAYVPAHFHVGTRNMMQELEGVQCLSDFFPEKEEETGTWRLTDDDGLYRLLTEGIDALQKLGTIYVSERMKRLNVRRTPHPVAGVSLSGDLLHLQVSSEDMSPEELAEVLTRYDRRQRYFRLRNGEFVSMEDGTLDQLFNLQDAMKLTEKQWASETISLPRYRALMLENMLGDVSAEETRGEAAADGAAARDEAGAQETGPIPFRESRDFRALISTMRDLGEDTYRLPPSLEPILRPYQKDGFRWLKSLKRCGFGGILADDMGLGKTLQVIALLLSEQEERPADMPPRQHLIVCPASLVYNWEAECKRFAPALDVRLIVGTAGARREKIETLRTTQLTSCFDDAIEPDVVCITSYELLRRDLPLYKDVRFDAQVIDEAQYIKNQKTKVAHTVKSIEADFRLALTGTPIENRLSELWSIFDFLMPGFLYNYETFLRVFERPIVLEGDKAAMARLQQMIRPFVLRRLKKDVLRDLPEKIEENVRCQMQGEQRELYRAMAQSIRMRLEQESDESFSSSKIEVLSLLTRLRQLCCDPSLIYTNYRGGSAKVDMALQLIESAVEGGHKVLLFSQFTTMLDILIKHLEEAGIRYHLLTGSTPKETRMRQVNDFATDNVPLFLISLKAGGTGLNLTAADVVIHFDPWWNLAVQNQATDRTHRIGQKHVVNVYQLIAKDSIEEKIVDLQERKSRLADDVLAADGFAGPELTREALLALLT